MPKPQCSKSSIGCAVFSFLCLIESNKWFISLYTHIFCELIFISAPSIFVCRFVLSLASFSVMVLSLSMHDCPALFRESYRQSCCWFCSQCFREEMASIYCFSLDESPCIDLMQGRKYPNYVNAVWNFFLLSWDILIHLDLFLVPFPEI